MIDVASAIDGEAVNVIRSRMALGAYDENGNYLLGTATSQPIRAAIQPTNGNQLRDMPEGIRTEAQWMCWSRSDLLPDDRIVHAGVFYRVLFTWPRSDGGFYRAALGRSAP